jgi:hypothetical protein
MEGLPCIKIYSFKTCVALTAKGLSLDFIECSVKILEGIQINRFPPKYYLAAFNFSKKCIVIHTKVCQE